MYTIHSYIQASFHVFDDDTINTLRPDDIFKCIFVSENIWNLKTIGPKLFPKGEIDHNTALVQMMAWCWISESMMA